LIVAATLFTKNIQKIVNDTNMKNLRTLLFLLCVGISFSCESFLSEKPSKNLVIPRELDDFQALLDARLRGMNTSPAAGLLGSDDIYLGPGAVNRLQPHQVSTYFWAQDFYLPGEYDPNWSTIYQKIFYSIVTLDGLAEYSPSSQSEASRKAELTASAKFYRALGHFEILTHFAPHYRADQVDQLGIPLRTTSDVNIKTTRATLEGSYQQIIRDLEEALPDLPQIATIPTRPSQWAVHALLSRVYMTRQEYTLANQHSSLALSIKEELMDYNELNNGLPYSFEIFNPEVIFYSELITNRYATNRETYINPDLVDLYKENDLRVPLFFATARVDTLYNMRGHYTGDFYPFGGLATDELWLDYAESSFRIGQIENAKNAINTLRQHRIRVDEFQPFEGTDSDLFEIILLERRRELVFRGIRWLDLKRLNTDPALAITLVRKFNTVQAELPPNDPRYAIPIPPDEIDFNPIEQNPR
jgi:starch-binding outer membrane protein, SusD/RagB family